MITEKLIENPVRMLVFAQQHQPVQTRLVLPAPNRFSVIAFRIELKKPKSIMVERVMVILIRPFRANRNTDVRRG